MEHLITYLHRPRTTRSPLSLWGDSEISNKRMITDERVLNVEIHIIIFKWIYVRTPIYSQSSGSSMGKEGRLWGVAWGTQHFCWGIQKPR